MLRSKACFSSVADSGIHLVIPFLAQRVFSLVLLNEASVRLTCIFQLALQSFERGYRRGARGRVGSCRYTNTQWVAWGQPSGGPSGVSKPKSWSGKRQGATRPWWSARRDKAGSRCH
jgi:hypothetical protein